MTVKTPTAETIKMMTLSIVNVSSLKLVMEIRSGIKEMLTTTFVLKGEPDTDEDTEWSDGDPDDFIDSGKHQNTDD